MNELTAAIVYTLLAGLMIPAGGFLASIEHIRPRWMETEFRHSVVAFGGGVLVAATALVLVPEGAENLPAITALGAFIAGGIVFAIAEKMNGGGSKAQLWVMLTDFVPEAVALGAMIAVGKPEAGLLALLIGMQNLPEGFNAYREMKHVIGRKLSVRTLMLFLALSLLGAAAGLSGYFLLADKPEIT